MKNKLSKWILIVLVSGMFFSCKTKSQEEVGVPYDPNKPVEVSLFYPDSGGMASKVIIEGANFGIDKSKVKVFFNKKEAAVVQSIGNKLYVITPRQPGKGDIINGDSCVISVSVDGSQAAVANKIFKYRTTTVVTTVCGVPETKDTERTGGDLTTARFSMPKYLTCDKEGLIYIVDWPNDWASKGLCYMVDNKENIVQALGGIIRSNAPCLDPTGSKILVPADGGTTYYEFLINSGYDQVTINPVRLNPTQWSMEYKHSLAPSVLDGLIYTVTRNTVGQYTYIAAIDQVRKTIDVVNTDINKDYSHGMIAFDPKNPEWLYIAQSHLNMISRFNIVTKTYESGWAGAKNVADHIDGPRNLARFNYPRQICFDYDGNLFIADTNNHCIRKISPDGNVTTVIGQRGKKGYVDGGPDDALFNSPEGVTVTPDNTVWIADTGNDVLRKLAIE